MHARLSAIADLVYNTLSSTKGGFDYVQLILKQKLEMYCKSFFFDRKQFYHLYKRVFINMARHNRQIVGAGSIQASTQMQQKFLGTYKILGGEEERWPVLMFYGKKGV